MQNLHRLLHTGLPLALAGALLAGCATAPDDAAVQALAAQVVDEAARNADFHGAVVLMRDGRAVFAQGIGLAQRDPDRAFTPDTPADGGSLAKTITAAALWELAAAGRLSLDDPVTQHLPGYPRAGQTVRHLVNHRNGLPDYAIAAAPLKAGQVVDTDDLLRLAVDRPPVFAPGVAVEYSNLGFDAAARVVEQLTGRGIAAWWQDRWFGPLDMTNTFARPARLADWPGPRTVGYRRDGERWVLNDLADGEAFVGASNVQASARDWARWGDAFARGSVLPPQVLDAGLRAATLDTGFDERLNLLSWYCDAPRERCHYSGAVSAFNAQIWWDRSRGEVVAWIGNSDLAPWRSARLTRDLVAALAGRASAAEPAETLVRVTRAERARWAGSYRSAALGTVVIDVNDAGRAFVRVNGGERVSLAPVPDGAYYAPMLDLMLGFTGTPGDATLHLRSVFRVADARRIAALPGSP